MTTISHAAHTLPRLFVPMPLGMNVSVALSPDQAHYLTHVMRLKDGQDVRLFNGQNGEWKGRIQAVKTGKKSVSVVPEAQLREQTPMQPLWLCAAPIKKAYYDFLIMKATELGVTDIQPILTARTQIRDVNIDRARSIAIEAAEQSERLSVPTLHLPRTLKDSCESWPREILPLVCAEFGTASPVATALASLAASHRTAAIITGPEGGFDADEMERLHRLPGALAIRLGPRILRADTAAIAMLSCWQALRGDWTTL